MWFYPAPSTGNGASSSGTRRTDNARGQLETGRFLFWTVDNRMHAAVDDKHYSYYTYDYTGERRLKLTGESNRLDVNADFMTTGTLLNTPTLYPSAYLVLTSKGYTKHYYAGADRVAASLGGGGLKAVGSNPGMQDRANGLFWESHDRVNGRTLQETGQALPAWEYYGFIKDIPGRMNASVEFYLNDLYDNLKMLAEEQHQEEDVYFYHSDHLGSASWITDADGKPIQHLQYLPFGEPFVNQHLTDYQERFRFTGKERDEETGYGYFGARYMDHELMTMWLSVDPMADKYPGISPYAYCAWKPVKLVDPNGMDVWPTSDEAYRMILSSLPPEARNYVKLNVNGRIDKNLINSYNCESQNFNDLKELVNITDCTVEVSVANSANYIDSKGNTVIEQFDVFNEAEFLKGLSGVTFSDNSSGTYTLSTGEVGNTGVTAFPVPLTTPGDDFHRSTNGNIQVTVCSQLSTKGRAETFAHEFFGHAYLFATTGVLSKSRHDYDKSTYPITERNIELKNRIIRAQYEASSYHR